MHAAGAILLAGGVAGAAARPWRAPPWLAPAAGAALALGAGLTSPPAARAALDPLREPLLFLLAAVPLAVMLDEAGFFAAVAHRLTAAGHGCGALWIVAAATTTVLNLDASVVLLTPLYVSVARHTGRDPLALAFQPVLLACLASSALPVSNLTNLIAAEATAAGTGDFLVHLGLPSLVATTVGWWLYRWYLTPDRPTGSEPGPEGPGQREAGSPLRPHPRVLAIGCPLLAAVLGGFVAGPAVGLAPWVVALAADVVLVVVLRRAPWRHLPWGTVATAGSLAVLAAATLGETDVGGLVGGDGPAALARTMAVAGVAANLANNLPALLVALPVLGDGPGPELWAVLVGVNMGPVVLVTGSLASLLWLDAVHRLGITVHARDFTRVGLRVGLPAALAGAATLLVLAGALG